MTTRRHVSFSITALSAAALLLAGCSSSGTVGKDGGSSGGHNSSSGGSSGGDSGDSGDLSGITGGSSSSSTGGSSGGKSVGGGTDAGCTEAMTAIQSAVKVQHSNDPKSALTTLKSADRQLRDAAGKTKKPGAKDAINKVADDLDDIVSDVQSGKKPSTSQALTDAQGVADACGS